MQNPLKQGLKLNNTVSPATLVTVAMQNPLKQGLKLVGACRLHLNSQCRNAKSTKTRIETFFTETFKTC